VSSVPSRLLGPRGTELGGGRWQVWGSVLDPRKKGKMRRC
jgi:hypothetical protein